MKIIEAVEFETPNRKKRRKKRMGAIPKGPSGLINLALLGGVAYLAYQFLGKSKEVTESVVPAPKNPNSPSEAELFKPYEY